MLRNSMEMLRRCMRATFASRESALGIIMGDMNLQIENIPDVLRHGNLGVAQDVDYHPSKDFLNDESCFDADFNPPDKSDYIFAGDSMVTPWTGKSGKEKIRLLGVYGEHAAMVANVQYYGPELRKDVPPVYSGDVNHQEEGQGH